MDELKGVILAGSATEEDDLVQRLNGRSRYAMPLANRALVRYAAEALAACGIEEVIVAVCPRTTEDVGELIGSGGVMARGSSTWSMPSPTLRSMSCSPRPKCSAIAR